ncbi:MAG: hypothetical protein QOF61_832 [Acidobacteriota bacterium]|jgi:hypothetical protein|nr:hypothetical protein [Acidobacteriota bacterium]
MLKMDFIFNMALKENEAPGATTSEASLLATPEPACKRFRVACGGYLNTPPLSTHCLPNYVDV